MNLVLLLGAGFSVPAGLPVGNALFEANLVPHSKKASRDIKETLSAWDAWHTGNPHGRAEEFISAVYASNPIGQMLRVENHDGLTYAFTRYGKGLWHSLVRFIGYRLANPFARFYGTGRSHENIFEARVCDAHKAWWDAILSLSSAGHALTVITLNWDIWVERALRPRPTPRLLNWSFEEYLTGGTIAAPAPSFPWRLRAAPHPGLPEGIADISQIFSSITINGVSAGKQ